MQPLRKALELTHAAHELPGHIVASLKNGGDTMVYGVKTTEGNAESRGGAAYRIATGIAAAEALVLLWVNAAVGIIGDGPVNLLYLGVLLVGFAGALTARFEPRGMALALFATAIAQMLIPVLALVIWNAGWHNLLIDPNSPNPPFHPGIAPVFGLNTVFAVFWIISAWVFRRAARGTERIPLWADGGRPPAPAHLHPLQRVHGVAAAQRPSPPCGEPLDVPPGSSGVDAPSARRHARADRLPHLCRGGKRGQAPGGLTRRSTSTLGFTTLLALQTAYTLPSFRASAAQRG